MDGVVKVNKDGKYPKQVEITMLLQLTKREIQASFERSHMAYDTNSILFSPTQPAAATLCPRMLENYQKRNNLFKARFFEDRRFSISFSIQLYESEPTGYTTICSKFIYLVSHNKYTKSEQNELRKVLFGIEYHKDLGLEKPLRRERVLQRLEDIKANTIRITRKPSMGTILLIEIFLKTYNSNLEECTLVKMHNSMISTKAKIMK
ncbi:MAG: hypothetical protein EXX96DRAFT_608495 [Benjaminiella poitrasii]|nr:MAG: hypothetical protein EXX96DRAFT_608495 [Benjaminiella poitrasii]